MLILCAGAFIAYANTFKAPFVFDDIGSIVENPTIRHLWPPGDALSPPSNAGLTVGGRPVLNLSLALNYAVSGLNVWSYHALNLLIHTLAGLTLFGLVRRTSIRPPLAARFHDKALALALVVAGLWTLHPLQTEAVTYVVQRTESLMGLFFLLALYAFLRAVDSPRPRFWSAAAFTSCLLGVGTKEIAALIPVVVFFFDRTFVSGTFRQAWQRHRGIHLALASTWLPLAILVGGTGGDRGGTKGFSAGIPWMDYWLTQFEAISRYLWLTFWPHPLIFDYPKISPPGFGPALLWALPVVALLTLTVVALKRWPVGGFLGVWFFVLLAPTSLVPGASQMIVEHRMYLPLAAVVALVGGVIASRCRVRSLLLSGAALAAAAGITTGFRNSVYAGERGLWEGVVAKYPLNARAHHNLGHYFFNHGHYEEAIVHYRQSLRIEPTRYTYHGLGVALVKLGRDQDAIAALTEAVRKAPEFSDAQIDLGAALTRIGRPAEALPHLAEAVRFAAEPAEAHFQAGLALAGLGRWPEAIEHYAAAVRASPEHAEAQNNWGVALVSSGDITSALTHFREALRLNPDFAEAHFNLALALTQLGRFEESIIHYAETVRLQPAHADAHHYLGVLLAQSGHLPEAVKHFEDVLKLRPDSPDSHNNLALALLGLGRTTEALSQYEASVRLRPQDPTAYYNLGCALLTVARPREAQLNFEQALRIDPSFAPAREKLQTLRPPVRP